MLNIKTFVFNPFQVNTYLIYDPQTLEGVIVDPGNSRKKENLNLSNFVQVNGISISKIIITHGHIDHLFGMNYAKNNITNDLYFPSPDIALLDHIGVQSQMVGMPIDEIEKPKHDLHSTGLLTMGKLEIEIRKVPGHSPGGTALVFHSEKKVLTGDTIFFESIGRTDLVGGNFEQLRHSINNEIFSLPLDYQILPGHGPETTVGHEINHNPFL